ncbi:MAG: UDP-N-acetylmuramoyl-L-alanine--D-glutamate ligase [Aestuariivita sp.]|nr:UDP-N-acetylmuramoyl-L-alanine--D-glutamate ligase [Aestuariivita sp.]
MIPIRGFQGQTIAVFGLGRTGFSAANSLIAGGATVVVWDDSESARNLAEKNNFVIRDLRQKTAFNDVDLLISSPGIPHLYPHPNPVIANAHSIGVPVDNDIGLFFTSIVTEEWSSFDSSPKVIAVTGSNGKSTTASLIQHIMVSAGKNCQLAGNIGRGALDLNPPAEGDIIVLELASYQTELARVLAPDVAAFTNFSPDHLERHGGIGGYFGAKSRLFFQGGADRYVVGVDEVEGKYLSAQLSDMPYDDRVIRISVSENLIGNGWSVFLENGILYEYRKERKCASVELRDILNLPGIHNHQNACVAFAVARALRLSPKLIGNALRTFEGLPHRSQRIAEVNNIVFINDSKATNIDSAIKALGAFENIRWICGGLEKEGGLKALAGKTAAVCKAYVIGRNADQFALQLDVEAEICITMAKAVARAVEDAEPGDTVLLAPAAASFDQYDNFECRGEDFIAHVEQQLMRLFPE